MAAYERIVFGAKSAFVTLSVASGVLCLPMAFGGDELGISFFLLLAGLPASVCFAVVAAAIRTPGMSWRQRAILFLGGVLAALHPFPVAWALGRQEWSPGIPGYLFGVLAVAVGVATLVTWMVLRRGGNAGAAGGPRLEAGKV